MLKVIKNMNSKSNHRIIKRKPTSKTDSLLKELVSKKDIWFYGYGLAKKTSVSLNTIYRLISKLEDDGLIEQKYVHEEDGSIRHLFKLTIEGHKICKTAIEAYKNQEFFDTKQKGVSAKTPIF